MSSDMRCKLSIDDNISIRTDRKTISDSFQRRQIAPASDIRCPAAAIQSISISISKKAGMSW